MKKVTFVLMALLAFTFSLKAQQYVSTEQTNKNVLIEDFTGRGCGYCPIAHRVMHEIMEANPGRVWGVAIHSAGGLSPTSAPNLNTTVSATISNAFPHDGIPAGVFNRNTAAANGINETGSTWVASTNQLLNQAAQCNVAGKVAINPATRIAVVTVEVYYTANSSVNENYLTVALLQDSIIGAQSDYGNFNPGGWVAPQRYAHNHVLRDIITPVWGDAIAPTTQGTLITRTYQYQIPEAIGDPNPVAVDLNNIHFLAFVTERYQGTPTRPIMNVCELETSYGVDEPVYPVVTGIALDGLYECTLAKTANIDIKNLGTDNISSMVIRADYGNGTYSTNWEGQLGSTETVSISLPVTAVFGVHDMIVKITEVNGQAFDYESTISVNCVEWVEHDIQGSEENLKLELLQDKFGNQITWEFIASDGTVIQTGGPYPLLASSTATQMHIERIMVPANDCVRFVIHDSKGDGIGVGYYIVKDNQNNVLFGDENNGSFGKEATHLFTLNNGQAQVVEVGATEVMDVNYNEASFVAPLNSSVYPDEVGFVYRKVTSSTPSTVVGRLNEFGKILATVDDLDHSTIYMVKAYATVNGQTYYGSETTFQTWMEGVDELENSLKVYPNPTSSVLNIEGEGMSSIEIYNAVGQRVMVQEVNGDKAQVSTESLNSGIYFIRIHANDGSMLNRTFSVAR